MSFVAARIWYSTFEQLKASLQKACDGWREDKKERKIEKRIDEAGVSREFGSPMSSEKKTRSQVVAVLTPSLSSVLFFISFSHSPSPQLHGARESLAVELRVFTRNFAPVSLFQCAVLLGKRASLLEVIPEAELLRR